MAAAEGSTAGNRSWMQEEAFAALAFKYEHAALVSSNTMIRSVADGTWNTSRMILLIVLPQAWCARCTPRF